MVQGVRKMKYICEVREIVISELVVEADSEEEARFAAEQAVYNSNGDYVHDSATETTAYVALPEMQKGGQYYDPAEVSR